MRVIKGSDELHLLLIENLYDFSACAHQIPQQLEKLPLYQRFCVPQVFINIHIYTCMKVSRKKKLISFFYSPHFSQKDEATCG